MNITQITHYIERNPPIRAYVEDLINCYEICKIRDSKSLAQKDLWFLLNQAGTKSCSTVYNSDVIDLIIKMSQVAREQSRGACVLSIVFIPEDVYIDIVTKAGIEKTAVCRVLSVEVLPSKYLSKDTVMGLCESKFPYPTVCNILITGKIKNAS